MDSKMKRGVVTGIVVAIISGLAMEFIRSLRKERKIPTNTDEKEFSQWTGDEKFFETTGDSEVFNNPHMKLSAITVSDLPFKNDKKNQQFNQKTNKQIKIK